MTVQTEPALATAHRLLDVVHTAALGTLSRGEGAPFVTLALVGIDHERRPLLLLSRLSEHMKNIAADPRVSLLLDGTHGLDDPMDGPRLTLLGRLTPDSRADARQLFLDRHPHAAAYAGFEDFTLLRLEITGAHLVAGYGRITQLDPAELNRGPALPLSA